MLLLLIKFEDIFLLTEYISSYVSGIQWHFRAASLTLSLNNSTL
jgi:hypothetical protein